MNPLPVNGPSTPLPAIAKASPLRQRLRLAAIDRSDAQPTADILVSSARAFILFHNKQHPSTLGLPEVTHFVEHLVRVGHDPAYGARPLKRIIQRELETALGRQLLEGKVRDGQAVEVGYDDKAKALTFEV